MTKSCPLNSSLYWKVIVFLGLMMFMSNFFYNSLYGSHPSILLIQSKTYFFNREVAEEFEDANLDFIKEDSPIELLHRKSRMMNKAAKKPVTKSPKLIDSRYNSKKIKSMTTGLFEASIRRHADSHKMIILAVVDEGYLSFAINFYKLSIKRHNLENFLFIALDEATKTYFKDNQIPHYLFPFKPFLKKAAKGINFGSKNFNYMTNMKTAVMIQALKLGYDVLMVDVDVIFFKNPLPYLSCGNCSMMVQTDRQLYNSGFVFAKNTAYSKQVYDLTWTFFLKLQKSHDQSYFNMAIHNLKEEKSLFELQVLPKDKFPCGVFYFEHVHRPFENLPACKECVLVHNNYIGSRVAKLYRMKENLLWMYDEGSYYSNSSLKYLTYENPFEFENTVEMELDALKSAVVLAAKLQRLLILPSFHCCSCSPPQSCSPPIHRCSLISILRLSTFDWALENRYREHSFLKNPQVPSSISESISPPLLVNNSVYEDKGLKMPELNVFQVNKTTDQSSLNEVSAWLGEFKDFAVINFHSLYNTKFQKSISEEDFKINHLLFLMKKAFECAEYEQWDKDLLLFK